MVISCVTPCDLIHGDELLGGSYCLRFKVMTLNMQTLDSSETFVHTYQIIWSNISKNHNRMLFLNNLFWINLQSFTFPGKSMCYSWRRIECRTFFINVVFSAFLWPWYLVNITVGSCWCCQQSSHFSIYLSMALQSFIGPWPFVQFLNLHAVSRTPWTRDQPVARPLSTHRTTQTE
jgi:hypothetical protein